MLDNPENNNRHQENAPPHTVTITTLELDVLGFNRLLYSAYSPDLAPMDYSVFPVIKSELRGTRFKT
jgi:hypothetical protein